MLTRHAARLVVEREANRHAPAGARLYVYDVDTIERPWGWVMFYGPLDRSQASVARGAAYLVNRVTGELLTAGSAWPIEKYIDDYETRLKSVTVTDFCR